jgi:hypothetical protein
MSGHRRLLKKTVLLLLTTLLVTSLTIAPVFARPSSGTLWLEPLQEPLGDTRCLSPLVLDMAWQQAISRALELVREGVLSRDVLDRLLDARANGHLPFSQPDRCAQLVFEPFTAALIVGAVILGITLLVWAIAMAGSV